MKEAEAIDRLRQVLRRQHKALATEDAYVHWFRRYIKALPQIPPGLSSEKKLEKFLTDLALKHDVAASTQNQAFNAILFFYQHVFEQPLGNVRALRASRPVHERYSPNVSETQALLQTVSNQGGYPTNLVARMLYGCGLRVSEPLNLRIKDVDLERRRFCIRGAKGGNDRVVAIPLSLIPELTRQMQLARVVWERDRQDLMPVMLPHRLARKYPEYQFSWGWAWLFPAHHPCRDPRNGAIVRYRMHEVIIGFTIPCSSVSMISLMELREFAERVLFSPTLEEKLACPPGITDEQPGTPLEAPEMPGRPAELRFKPRNASRIQTPGLHELEQTAERGRLLHFFANHELLATELMALALLRFPDAPAAFRRGVLQTLQQEQQHTAWYVRRMKECGISFGELPVSGYFWRTISPMRSPLDYLAGLSLTFEQANLDFTRFFSSGFAQVGDAETSRLLDRIYQDEIGHVAYGLKWFRKWKDPQQSDWDAFCRQLRFPMSAQRAKGPIFNIEGRLAAGLDHQFIDELNVYAQSKGRTPGVFIFNPFAEGRIAQGKSLTPNLHQQQMQQDLENLPQFLCHQDDVVLVKERPSASFLSALKAQGWIVPEFVTLKAGRIDADDSLLRRKLGKLSPWAWGPDSQEVLAPLFANITAGSRNPGDYYNEKVARIYSKAWSADLLRTVLNEMRARKGEPPTNSTDEIYASGCELASLLCTQDEVGVAASTVEEVLRQINAIRSRGHHNVLIKEAIGVAGHNAIRLLERELLDTQKRWITTVVENGRQVVVEPWLDRQLDFSIQLEMGTAGLRLVGYTGLSNDWKGQFRGNWAWPGFHNRICLGLEGLFPHVADIVNRVRYVYAEILSTLERELRNSGYFGPIGIDAFVYRTPQGPCLLKPIVEINPRYTMGRLTLELMKNVAPGRTGTFQLVNQKQIESEGFQDFPSWARTAQQRCPPRLEGKPVPRLAEGFMCLNDPARAQVCLAIFNVT